jgi:hypothetical protein
VLVLLMTGYVVMLRKLVIVPKKGMHPPNGIFTRPLELNGNPRVVEVPGISICISVDDIPYSSATTDILSLICFQFLVGDVKDESSSRILSSEFLTLDQVLCRRDTAGACRPRSTWIRVAKLEYIRHF